MGCCWECAGITTETPAALAHSFNKQLRHSQCGMKSDRNHLCQLSTHHGWSHWSPGCANATPHSNCPGRKTISLCKCWSPQNGHKVKSTGEGCSSQSSDKKYWLRAALKHVMLFYFIDFLFSL